MGWGGTTQMGASLSRTRLEAEGHVGRRSLAISLLVAYRYAVDLIAILGRIGRGADSMGLRSLFQMFICIRYRSLPNPIPNCLMLEQIERERAGILYLLRGDILLQPPRRAAFDLVTETIMAG